jgi:hypothetical protein
MQKTLCSQPHNALLLSLSSLWLQCLTTPCLAIPTALLQPEILDGGSLPHGGSLPTPHTGNEIGLLFIPLLGGGLQLDPPQEQQESQLNDTQMEENLPAAVKPNDVNLEIDFIFQNLRIFDQAFWPMLATNHIPQTQVIDIDDLVRCYTTIRLFLKQLFLKQGDQIPPDICSKDLSRPDIIQLAMTTFWIKKRVCLSHPLGHQPKTIQVLKHDLLPDIPEALFLQMQEHSLIIVYKPPAIAKGTFKKVRAALEFSWEQTDLLFGVAILHAKDIALEKEKKVNFMLHREYAHYRFIHQAFTEQNAQTPSPQVHQLEYYLAPHALQIIPLPDGNVQSILVQPLYRCTFAYASQLLTFTQQLLCALHIATALDIMHSAGVIHSDLKETNILIGYQFEIVIADLGGAFIKGAAPFIGGTTRYMPAEAEYLYWDPRQHLIHEPEKIDIYSFGTIFLPLLFPSLVTLPEPPILSQTHSAQLQEQKDGYWGSELMWTKKKQDHEAMHSFSKFLAGLLEANGRKEQAKLAHLLSLCLDVDPQKRPTAYQIKQYLRTLDTQALLSTPPL